MRDYAAISKRLRRYSENCVAYKLDADFADAVSDAADAIEELLDELTTIRKQFPRWTSVEELLAERTAFWVDTQPHLDDFSYKKDGMSYYCSNCHHRAGKYKHRSYKFCPWCGAKIVPKEMAVRNED